MLAIQKERLVSEYADSVPGFVVAPVVAMMPSPSFGWEFASYLATSRKITSFFSQPRWKWIRAAIQIISDSTSVARDRKNSLTGAVREAASLYRDKECREVLNALLITRGVDFGSVAWQVRKSRRVIEAYHELFFDVADRQDDEESIDSLFREKGFRLVRPATSEFPGTSELKLLSYGRRATIGDVCHARTNSALLRWRRGAEKRCRDMLRESRAEKAMPLGDRVSLLQRRLFLQSRETMFAEINRPR